MERAAWLALIALHVEGGRLKRRDAVKLVAEKLACSRRHARNILRYLVERGYVEPVVRGIAVEEVRITEKGREVVNRILTPLPPVAAPLTA
ncbi:MAG: hypothetical protein QXZ31_09295 [Thermofilaceae archaeon]